jgi:hypothetical protein
LTNFLNQKPPTEENDQAESSVAKA